MRIRLTYLPLLTALFSLLQPQAMASAVPTDTINLAGEWRFELPYAKEGTQSNGTITLPGTLDNNGLGETVPPSVSTTSLSRRHTYTGPAVYSHTVTIPEDWAGKTVTLTLERTRPALIEVDGTQAGMCSLLSAPHLHDLSAILTPGQHELKITVDNGIPIPAAVRLNSNMCSEQTQTNWNGILGQMLLTASDGPRSRPSPSAPALRTDGRQFLSDGNPAFLRGTVDACVWPLTGFPPMDEGTWDQYFARLSSFGLNHVRFHTWCPPEAAFAAADKAGFFLMPELPLWGELDGDREGLLQFLEEELEGVISAYGHHPSFAMLSLGNELWGDTSIMRRLADRARELKPGLLVCFGSNVYLGSNGHMDGEDFLTATRTAPSYEPDVLLRGHFPWPDIPGGGAVETATPSLTEDYSKAVALSPVPAIAHETGQYLVYPDFTDTLRFRGVLRPDNFTALAQRADSAGLLPYAAAMHDASGRWAMKLYKAEMEKALATPAMGGFHLQSFQDYPGQGTATVGMTDLFGETKGFAAPGEWRGSCAPLTVLAMMPRFTFTAGETVSIPVRTANYTGHDLTDTRMLWKMPFASGSLTAASGQGVNTAGEISVSFPRADTPRRYDLTLTMPGQSVGNTYPLWVFPPLEENRNDGVLLTESLPEALEALERGRRVVLCPDSASTAPNTVGGLFANDFWNWNMYAVLSEKLHKPFSPGTLGLLLTDPGHSLFKHFPTEGHTDWQWHPVLKASRPLVIDRLPKGFNPLVRVIDNPDRSWPLALAAEFNVGKGRLLLICADLAKLRESLPGRWFLESALRYAASSKFKPSLTLTPAQLESLLTRPSLTRLLAK